MAKLHFCVKCRLHFFTLSDLDENLCHFTSIRKPNGWSFVFPPLVSTELVRMVMSGWGTDALLGFQLWIIPNPFYFSVVLFVILPPESTSSYLQHVCDLFFFLTYFLFKVPFLSSANQPFISIWLSSHASSSLSGLPRRLAATFPLIFYFFGVCSSYICQSFHLLFGIDMMINAECGV